MRTSSPLCPLWQHSIVLLSLGLPKGDGDSGWQINPAVLTIDGMPYGVPSLVAFDKERVQRDNDAAEFVLSKLQHAHRQVLGQSERTHTIACIGVHLLKSGV